MHCENNFVRKIIAYEARKKTKQEGKKEKLPSTIPHCFAQNKKNETHKKEEKKHNKKAFDLITTYFGINIAHGST